ncbi:MAG: FecR domain-containing protein [Robiginitomaculum sp.]|nr:FecR domain-containing protein [Robiginitomaculum sp.]
MKTDSLNIIPLPDNKRIESEAAEWIMRLQEDNITEARIADFKQWRSQSNRHKKTFEELSRFWGGLDFVEQLADYGQNDAAIEPVQQDRAARRMKYFKRVAVGALAATILVMVGIPSYKFATRIEPGFAATYQTAIGEQETINLPDGSQIILNTNSVVSVAFSKENRKIFLSKGEAFFEVESDKSKPFSVNTDKGIVTAIGTAFSVRLTDNKLDVLVTEGRVTLKSTPLKPTSDILIPNKPKDVLPVLEVSAGQAAVLGGGVESVSIVLPPALEKQVDWQDGELSFKGETLGEVINDISRYTDLTIEIAGEDLRAQRIVAYYKVGDVERLFEALNVMANIEVERVSNTHVKLYRPN